MTKKQNNGTAPLTAPSCHYARWALALVLGAFLAALCPRQSMAGEDRQDFSPPDKDSPGRSAADAPAPLGTWRTIHTKSADGATETTAILRVADVLKSDPRLAGLMLRCSKQGVELVIVVVEPFSPQARPRITLRADDQEFYFEGKPLVTGEGLRVPADGLDLARGSWKGARQLTIKVADGGAEIDGVVELSGLADAIQSLTDCARK